MKKSILTLATLLVIAAVPATAGAYPHCTYNEVVSVEDVASYGVFTCRETDHWTYYAPGTGVGGACEYVPAVALLGQPVPGTGKQYCVDGASVPSQSGGFQTPGEHVIIPVAGGVSISLGPGLLCYVVGAKASPYLTCTQVFG